MPVLKATGEIVYNDYRRCIAAELFSSVKGGIGRFTGLSAVLLPGMAAFKADCEMIYHDARMPFNRAEAKLSGGDSDRTGQVRLSRRFAPGMAVF